MLSERASVCSVALLVTCACCPCVLTVLDGAALRIDDRLRVAKERREEADKQQGMSAVSVLEFFVFEAKWGHIMGRGFF